MPDSLSNINSDGLLQVIFVISSSSSCGFGFCWFIEKLKPTLRDRPLLLELVLARRRLTALNTLFDTLHGRGELVWSMASRSNRLVVYVCVHRVLIVIDGRAFGMAMADMTTWERER